MLPVLFKLTFDTALMKAVYLFIAALLTAYGFWAGWRGADSRAVAPWRALPFAVGSALASCIAAVWAFPPMDGATAKLVKALVWGLAALLVATSALYNRRIAEKGEETNKLFTGAAIGAAIGFMAIKWGLGGPLGRNYGAPLHTYGLLIATAFIVAIWVATREAERSFPEQIRIDGKWVPAGPIMREHVVDLGFWVLVSAIIGSRILFIIVNWKDYRSDPSQIFSLTGGLVFYGGFIGAVSAAWFFCRHYRLPFLRLFDVAIPSVALGHVIGRLGCLSAGCCWGDIAKEGSAIAIRFPAAKHLPFGGFGTDSLAFQDQLKDHRWVDSLGHLFDHSVAGAQQISAYAKATGYSMPVYPTQLMESAGELTLFLLLLTLRRYKRFHGQIVATWLIGYSMLRTTIEFFRGDVARGYLFRWPEVDPLLLSTSQTVSIGIFLCGVAIWVLHGRRQPEQQPQVTPAA